MYVVVEVSNDRLSLDGVVGPGFNGEALGPSGKINTRFARRSVTAGADQLLAPDAITFADGWDAERWLDLLDIWSEYDGVPIDRVPSRVKGFLDAMPAAERPGAWRTLLALGRRT
jgi:hypothetical protein